MSYNYNNYIYLRYANYKKYEATGGTVSYFNTKRDNVLSTIKGERYNESKKTAEFLEKQLNSFFSASRGSAVDGGITAEQAKNISDRLNQILLERFFGLYTFDTTTGAPNKNHAKNNEEQKLKKIIKIVEDANNGIELLNAKMRDFQALYKQLSDNSASLKQEIDTLLQLWEQVQQEANAIISKGGEVSYNTKGAVGKTPASYKEFVKTFNNTVDSVFRGTGSRVAGAVGEYLVALIMEVLTDGAIEAEKAVVGDLRSYAIINDELLPGAFLNNQNSDKIFDNLFSNFKKKNITIKGKNTSMLLNARATQQKVDVSFSYMGDIINASVKNINLNRADSALGPYIIGAVSGTNPFVLLSEDATVFHHYLNITSMHSSVNDSKISSTPPEKPYEPASQVIQAAHETIKTLMMIRAVSGTGKRLSLSSLNKDPAIVNDYANYFILNDSSKGRFYVRTMGDLLQSLVDHNQLFFQVSSKNPTKTVKNPDGSTTKVATEYTGYPENPLYQYSIGDYIDWDKGGQARMQHIYEQLKKQRIEIKISARYFIGNQT